MGWISAGLLLISGGCILYRHPPASIIQLLVGYLARRTPPPLQPPAQLEDDLRDAAKDKTASIPTVTLNDRDAPVHDPDHHYSSLDADAPRILPQSSPAKPPRSTIPPPRLTSMPPPPRPSRPPTLALNPPPSTASTLRLPPASTSTSTLTPPSRLLPRTTRTTRPRRPITLKPGHSPLDWAALTSTPTSTPQLRGRDAPSPTLIRVTPSRLRAQNGRKGKDAWALYLGKVYNVTAYLPFHPGGEAELMRAAGRDAVVLFQEVHPWVNWEGMLGECLVGIMVGEGEGEEDGEGGSGYGGGGGRGGLDLEEMD